MRHPYYAGVCTVRFDCTIILFFSNLKARQNLSILITNCEFSHAMFLTATVAV